MTTMLLLTCLSVASAAEPAAAEPPRLRRPAPVLSVAWMPRSADTTNETSFGSEATSTPKRRSKALLLGALGAEVAAGALLGGAALTRDMYVDPSRDPSIDLYRANRTLGHAGYASAVAGGALVLGSIALWEW
jgi:hypothetical protein